MKPSAETLTELYRAAIAQREQADRAVDIALAGIRKHAPELESQITASVKTTG